MRWRTRLPLAILALLVWLGWPTLLLAQVQLPNLGSLASPTGLGNLSMSPGQLLGAGSGSQTSDDSISVTDSFVSFIDGAPPRNLVMLRMDLGYDMTQPSRAEYYFAKGSFPLVETRVNSLQEINTYAEIALASWFSLFIDAPYRWVNPDVNGNAHGPGDLQYGFKLCTWSTDGLIATIQARVYQPTASVQIAPDHWTIEPGLLVGCQLIPSLLIEGQLRCAIPIGGSEFAGDVLCYGIGLSYGQRQPGFWFVPVLECVGWTALSGKSVVATSPQSFYIEDARNQTIINGCLGMRFGYGGFDFYAGYARCFSGDCWFRDNIRLELRFTF